MSLRKLFILTLALSLLLAPPAADAQQAGKVPRIGFLAPGRPEAIQHFVEAFRQGLRELGYVEGQNLIIEWRWAEGRYDRLPDLAADLVQLKAAVIVATAPPAAYAAKSATKTIPIVIVTGGDLVGEGLAASLARPGGNITGLTTIAIELAGKQLELLKEAVPKVSRVVLLWNPTNPGHEVTVRETQVAARSLGLQLQILEARGPDEIDRAFAAMTRERAEALVVQADPIFMLHRTRIADLAAISRLPSMYSLREHAEAGGLMAYGASRREMYRRTATYVDKILKGAKPGDLPIEQPTRFELAINLKTAKALGLTIPQSVLMRADKVVQ